MEKVRAEEDALRAWSEIGADISDSGAAVLSPGEVLWEVALRGGTLRAVFDTDSLDCDEGTESSGAVLDICGESPKLMCSCQGTKIIKLISRTRCEC